MRIRIIYPFMVEKTPLLQGCCFPIIKDIANFICSNLKRINVIHEILVVRTKDIVFIFRSKISKDNIFIYVYMS